jgi:beta-lysine 5,6-aminomutase alpha subunit
VTPWLSDRDLALKNVQYVLDACSGLSEDFRPPPGGFIDSRANLVLSEALSLLERIVDDGLLAAVGDGTFAGMRRPADGGKGLDGVMRKAPAYVNPALDLLAAGS